MNEPNEDGIVRIPLDGTYGAGPDAELTIVTKGEEGQQIQKTYTIPYLAVDTKRLQQMNDINFILDYSLIKTEAKAMGLKELGL